MIPVLEEQPRTYYKYECPCGMAKFSVEIHSLMTNEEAYSKPFDHDRGQYKKEFIDRAESLFIESWNKRSR